MMIPLFYPQIYRDEWLSALGEAFNTRWLGQGPKVDEFEKKFGEKFGYEYCLAVNSGSAALELAYDLVGIREGDEILTTVFTCTATNLPLVRRKAKIVFCDIDDDLLISRKSIQEKITRRTKAIVVVNLGGLQVDPFIAKIAAHRKIPLIIDAAQSLGIKEDIGDYICYSFQAVKHFTTGDGGMLVCRDKKDHERAKKLRWFGIDREKKKANDWRCMVGHQMAQEIEEPGYKFHMNDITATMGLVGLKHSDEILLYRQGLVKVYRDMLPNSLSIVAGGACWLLGVLTAERDKLMSHLRENGVECDQVQLRNDLFKVFGGERLPLPNMNLIENKYFYLPLHGKVTVKDVHYIAEVISNETYS